MEITISKKFENKLLNREEYELVVDFKGSTPKREQIRDKLSALVNSKPNLVIVKKVFNKAGVQSVVCKVYVYKNDESMRSAEPKYLLERNAKKELKGETKEDKPKKEGEE
ncbi:30S ribosomal protein S24e [Candidatus Micrarchaeota archaeon]|nr:30S ribosomal protein S24e [Candidatus Micrarchaeota archaeon]